MIATRTVLVWRGKRRTVHQLDCPFITRRINNGLTLEDQYDEVPAKRQFRSPLSPASLWIRASIAGRIGPGGSRSA